MATRFYFPSSGTPPLPNQGSRTYNGTIGWEILATPTRLPTTIAKSNTALTTFTRTWPAGADWDMWGPLFQFQSAALTSAFSVTTAQTVTAVVGKCGETAAADNTCLCLQAYVVSGDGSVVRGTLAQAINFFEFPLIASAASRQIPATNPLTNFTAQVGDRVIIEIGLWNNTHGVVGDNQQLRFGDPSAVADFALADGLTTDLDGWFEFSGNLVFAVAGPDLIVLSTSTSPVSPVGGDAVTFSCHQKPGRHGYPSWRCRWS